MVHASKLTVVDVKNKSVIGTSSDHIRDDKDQYVEKINCTSSTYMVTAHAFTYNKLNPFSKRTDEIRYQVWMRCENCYATEFIEHGNTGFDNQDLRTTFVCECGNTQIGVDMVFKSCVGFVTDVAKVIADATSDIMDVEGQIERAMSQLIPKLSSFVMDKLISVVRVLLHPVALVLMQVVVELHRAIDEQFGSIHAPDLSGMGAEVERLRTVFVGPEGPVQRILTGLEESLLKVESVTDILGPAFKLSVMVSDIKQQMFRLLDTFFGGLQQVCSAGGTSVGDALRPMISDLLGELLAATEMVCRMHIEKVWHTFIGNSLALAHTLTDPVVHTLERIVTLSPVKMKVPNPARLASNVLNGPVKEQTLQGSLQKVFAALREELSASCVEKGFPAIAAP